MVLGVPILKHFRVKSVSGTRFRYLHSRSGGHGQGLKVKLLVLREGFLGHLLIIIIYSFFFSFEKYLLSLFLGSIWNSDLLYYRQNQP